MGVLDPVIGSLVNDCVDKIQSQEKARNLHCDCHDNVLITHYFDHMSKSRTYELANLVVSTLILISTAIIISTAYSTIALFSSITDALC
jgi:hypothetical protein